MSNEMTTRRNSDCTVLVASCDKYADLLGPFSTLWRKFWPDCPFETVLVTETVPSENLAFDRVIACGKGRNWCARLVDSLKQIETRYVLLLCDDYYLAAAVDTTLVLKRLEQANRFDAVNLRLIPNPVTKIPYREGLREYRKNTAYCMRRKRASGIANSFWGLRATRRVSGSSNDRAASTWQARLARSSVRRRRNFPLSMPCTRAIGNHLACRF